MNNGAEHGQRAGDEGNDSTVLNARPGYIYIYYVDRRKSAADDQEMASADIHHPHAPVFVFLVKHDPNEDLDRDLAERLIDQTGFQFWDTPWRTSSCAILDTCFLCGEILTRI